MTAARLAIAFLVLILLLGLGVWYYLFGPNKTAAADLVPSDTIAFATIPNAARIVADYQGSRLKKIVDAPEFQPVFDSLRHALGPKNMDLLMDFLPELSGQSFLAVTHFDPTNLAGIGLIGGLKPKPGAGDFTAFVEKWKAANAATIAQGTTGSGQVEGLDYQWIKGPGASDKICVAQTDGWIITAWGEGALRDWWERWQKKSAMPSLSQNGDYQKSLKRVGLDSEAIVFLNVHSLVGALEAESIKSNPALSHYLSERTAGMGAFAIGFKFENDEIADHFSLLMPRQAQLAAGYSVEPCAFDTLKFTGPDTRLYWASSLSAWQNWINLRQQPNFSRTPAGNWTTSLKSWALSRHLDLQRNVIGPLGDEVSTQVEWSADTAYPEAGLYVKLDKPDDFKPTIDAIIETVRERYATSAVINEINVGDQKFATLKFVQALPISPTITENGPYFGLFLTENQAVRSFKRDITVGLATNDEFKSKLGDRRKQASQIMFLDTPPLLDRGYQTVLPYVSLAAMFNPTLGALVHGRNLPSDLQCLAPIGAWSFVSSHDDDGISAYSISGIGNQGIFLSVGLSGLAAAMRILHPSATAAVPGLLALPSGSGTSAGVPSSPAPMPPAPATPDADATNAASPALSNVAPFPAPPVAPVVPADTATGNLAAPASSNLMPTSPAVNPAVSPTPGPSPVAPPTTNGTAPNSIPVPAPVLPNAQPPASGPATNI